MNIRELIITLDSIDQKVVQPLAESAPTKKIINDVVKSPNTGIAKELVESFGYEYIYEAEVGQVVNFSGEPYKWMGAQWQNQKTGRVAEKGIKDYLNKLSAEAPKTVTTTAAKTAAKTALKTGGKMALKAAPFVGSALSAKEAYDRWQKGDRTGAVISALAGVGWLVPGPMGWVLGGGLDAANVARDLNNPEKQAAQPASARITALQKELKAAGADLGTFGPNGDGIDGKMGEFTRKAAAANPKIADKYKDVLSSGQAAQPATPTATPAEPEDTRTPLEKYYDTIGTRK